MPNPTETCAEAAETARAAAKEAPLGSPARTYGMTLAELFDTIGHDLNELGGLSPRMRRVGVDLAGAFTRLHRDDEQLRERFAEMLDAGEPFAVATEVMTTNAELSPAGSAPRALAEAFLDLFAYVTHDETEVDEVLLDLLRKLALAVIDIDESGPELEEIALPAGDMQVGIYPDGTPAVVHVGVDQLAGKSRAAVEQLLDEYEAGRVLAADAGIAIAGDSMRFRLRSVDGEPTRVDVYDQAGERMAIITEQPSKHGEHAEWHVGVIVAGAAKSAASVSFARVVEHLDRFIAEHVEGRL